MAKRREIKPTQVYIPVFIPTEDGINGNLELGKATIKGGTLIIEFNNKLPSVAIQRRIERGDVVGVTFVIPEEEAEQAREAEEERKLEAMSQDERDFRDLELLQGDEITPEDIEKKE
jgi:cation transport regulator ChaC